MVVLPSGTSTPTLARHPRIFQAPPRSCNMLVVGQPPPGTHHFDSGVRDIPVVDRQFSPIKPRRVLTSQALFTGRGHLGLLLDTPTLLQLSAAVGMGKVSSGQGIESHANTGPE